MMVSHRGAKPARHLSVVRRSANSLSMNLRHAAALAIVGWYLIVAPPQAFKDHKYHEVPLGDWTHKATFSSEFECKREQSRGCHHFENGEIVGLEGPLCYSQCIASDDLRLKEK
jgi:hypothetical protein